MTCVVISFPQLMFSGYNAVKQPSQRQLEIQAPGESGDQEPWTQLSAECPAFQWPLRPVPSRSFFLFFPFTPFFLDGGDRCLAAILEIGCGVWGQGFPKLLQITADLFTVFHCLGCRLPFQVFIISSLRQAPNRLPPICFSDGNVHLNHSE